MAMNYEFDRHIRAAQDAHNGEAVRVLMAQQTVFRSLVNAGAIQELPLETRPIELQAAPVSEESPEKTPPIPNFYIKRSIEGVVFPSADQLVVTARKELKDNFGRDFEVPEPSVEVFDTLRAFAERGINNRLETFYLPGVKLTENDRFWKGRGKVKPEPYFWEQIKEGNFPQEAATLEEGWYIGDKRGKPKYDNGLQRYGVDDFMEPLMAYLRELGSENGGIQKYSRVPDSSRFGASPQEIEGVILPTFAEMTGAKGIVRNRRYIEFNVRGNIAHPEWGQTDTWEWFGDPAFPGDYRLVGGGYSDCGLADVHRDPVGRRVGSTAFSPAAHFPSKPR